MKWKLASPWVAAATVAIFGATFAGSARGQEQPNIGDLLEKIRLLETRVHELEENADANAGNEIEKRINVLAEAAEGAATDFHGGWHNTTQFVSEDKNFKIKIGGRTHFDMVWNTQDEDISDNFGRFEDGFLFRRARLYVEGEIYKNVFFKSQFDFAGGEIKFRDNYIGVKDVLGGGKITVGYYKQPFSLGELTSSNDISFVERELGNALAPSRQSGIMYDNTFCDDDRIYLAFSFFRFVNEVGDSSPPLDGDYAIAFRLTGLPIYEDEGETLLHVGVGVVYQNPNDETIRFRARPETSIGPRIVDTGNITDADDVIRLNLELALVLGSFHAEAEYFHVFVDSASTNDPEFWSAYVQLGYFLTGEVRPYKNSAAAFTRVKPKANWHDGGDGLGAWEILVRYSYIDLEDEGVSGNELGDLTFGVTWYINPNTKVKFNYTWGDGSEFGPTNDTSGSVHIFSIRWQIDF